MSADFIFEKSVPLEPDKNRACTRRTVSMRRFFCAPKANVKMMDKKIFTILSLFSPYYLDLEIKWSIFARVQTYDSIPREDSDQALHQHY